MINKKVRIPVPSYGAQELPPKILLVTVPERNIVALPNSAAPSKNKSGEETLKAARTIILREI